MRTAPLLPFQSPATRQHAPGTRLRCAAVFCHVCAASSWLGPCAVPKCLAADVRPVHPLGGQEAAEGERIETSAVVAEGDRIWTQVIDIAWTKRKYFLSRKYVNQETGADLDEGQIQLEKEKAKAQEQRAARAAQVVAAASARARSLHLSCCACMCERW